jgi:uncharacterized membrane protein (DUF441 family)
MSDFQNSLFDSTMNIFNSLSFYSPIIICVSIVLFSMFTSTMEKAFVFFIWIFIITFIRIIAFKGFKSNQDFVSNEIPNICLTGLSQLFIPKDVTYSIYILTFTMMYLFTPMLMVSKQHNVNIINYGILGFFLAYLALDLGVKYQLKCIKIVSSLVIGDVLSGLFLGGVISGIIMYGSTLKSYLYINEINANKEVCSMPSKQQFKCRVFKDGTLIGNM